MRLLPIEKLSKTDESPLQPDRVGWSQMDSHTMDMMHVSFFVRVRISFFNICANASLVLVLPTLPVIAMNFVFELFLTNLASLINIK